MIPRRRLFGLDFLDLDSLDPLVEELATWRPRSPGPDDPPPVVVTPNVDLLVKLDQHADAASTRVFGAARYVLPDGQPVVWASRLLGEPLSSRLPGSDLVDRLWPRLLASGARTMVVAPSEEVATRVESDSPAARAVVAPMLDADDPTAMAAFADRCCEEIDEHQPSHVFVAMSFPKPYQLVDQLLERLGPTGRPVPVMLAIGAAFEMHYGLVPRAPEWMQRWGLEWFYRFLKEPRRLFRRYFVEDPAFLWLVWKERTARRRARPAS